MVLPEPLKGVIAMLTRTTASTIEVRRHGVVADEKKYESHSS